MKMLSKLRIDGFRGIRDLEIDRLSQVNLIVGDNNCGKTSMLEAIQLLRSGSAANIYRVARHEGICIFHLRIRFLIVLFVCFPKTYLNLRFSFLESIAENQFPMCYLAQSQGNSLI